MSTPGRRTAGLTTRAEEVERIAELAREAGTIALDTEFVGEGRYLPLLCLIQAAVPDGERPDEGEVPPERVALIDPLGCDSDGLLGPLADVLADREIEVVVHAGRQDVAILRRTLGADVTNLFDTQLAAGFVGLPAQSSYGALTSRLLGLSLGKSASFTRWNLRPLSGEQLSYAREDVIHLPALAVEIKRRLAELGRLSWATQECEQIAATTDGRDLESAFSRLPRLSAAGAVTQEIAYELARWREQAAERADRTVQSVLGDAVLMEIARRAPTSVQELRQIRGAGGAASGRSGTEIVTAVRSGAARKPGRPRRTGSPSRQPDPQDAPLVALAEALARATAQQAGLAYELLCTKAELQALVAAKRAGEQPSTIRMMAGWRRELLGEKLLRLLDGQMSLSALDGELHVREPTGN